MLNLYRDGLTTDTVIQPALGISSEEFDRGFEDFIGRELASTLEGQAAWREHSETAIDALRDENWEDVVTAATAGIASYPQDVSGNSVYLMKARAHDELEQRAAATETLAQYWRRGGHEPTALKRLALWFAEAERTAEAIDVLKDALYASPLDDELHIQLGDWLLEEQLPSDALREYEASLAMNPHDQAAAYYRLATAYQQLSDDAKTLEHVLYALEIAPHYREAQQLLLEIAR